jgi:hypothetical protein
MTLLGIGIAYVGFLGAFEVLDLTLVGAERGGGRIGRFEAGILEPLLTSPGAFVVLLALGIVGLMLAFNLRLRQVVKPVTGTAKWVGRRRPRPRCGASRSPSDRAGRPGRPRTATAMAPARRARPSPGRPGRRPVAGTTSSPARPGSGAARPATGTTRGSPRRFPSTVPDVRDVRPGSRRARH